MVKSPTLYDQFSHQGFWWLPDNPDQRWAGTISYTPTSGVILNLLVSGIETDRMRFGKPEHEIIQGFMLTGEQVTLLYCSYTGNTVSTPEVGSLSYAAEAMLIGYCFANLDDIEFLSLRVGYSSLKAWLQSAIPFTHQKIVDGEETIYEIKYVEKAPEEIRISSLNAIIRYGLGLNGDLGVVQEFRWEEEAYIWIEPDKPQSISWYFDKITSIRDLLAILMGLPVHRKWLAALTKKQSDGHSHPIQIYHSIKPPTSEAASNLVMPLAAQHLGKLIPLVFQYWFDKQESIRALSDLSLSVLYNAHRFWKFEFLALMQALESYHQIIHPKCRRVKPNGMKRDCELRERLEELYLPLASELKAHINLGGKFLDSLIDTRNYYTHYNPKKRSKALDGQQLYGAIIRLITFVVILMFKELGIPDRTIKEALNRTGGYGLWWRSSLHL